MTIKKDEKPDVIIASSMSLLTFFTTAIVKKRFKCKLVLEIRDIWPDSLVEMSSITNRNLFVKILHWVEIFGYTRADAFVSTLPHFDDYLRTKIKGDFKFLFIPQGFDKDFISLIETDQFNDVFLPDKFNICYAGTIGQFNNVSLLIEVAKILRGSDIRFIILGRGPLKKELQEQNNEMGNVVFLDFIPKQYVISVISKADLMIFPSRYFSIFQYGVSPNKWIDYMLAGRPILDTHIPNLPYYKCILKDADCAFLLNSNSPEILAETILTISQMPTVLLKQMGERGREYAHMNLNYDILGKKFLDFIQEIVGKQDMIQK